MMSEIPKLFQEPTNETVEFKHPTWLGDTIKQPKAMETTETGTTRGNDNNGQSWLQNQFRKVRI